MEMRECSRCGESKPIDRFREVKGYRIKQCRQCNLVRRYEREAENPEIKDRRNALRRRSNKNLKITVLDTYGGRCACCAESNPAFLSIDHIDGGGSAHRKSIVRSSSGSYFYRWLRDQGYPEGFQVLCFNCSFARHWNGGVCPHQEGE